MDNDLQDAINKGLIEVGSVGLTDLQNAVNNCLGLRLTSETIPYNPKPRYWIEFVRALERDGGTRI